MAGSLYVVSTPIGNLDDITLRALNVLKSVGLIAAEDTRRTGILLRHFGIDTPTTSLHEHNEKQKAPQLLSKLAEGTDVALVSDAGTPLVADPGQRLISSAIDAGLRVIPVPGASAVLSALAVSGFGADEFVFAGFAPSKSFDRKKWLAQFSQERRPVVFFETPHRISQMLLDASELLVDRPIIVARELTKLHEEVIRTTTAKVSGLHVLEKGEFTIILGPLPKLSGEHSFRDPVDVRNYFDQLTNTSRLSRREAIADTARAFGLSTNAVYALLERLKTSPPS